MQEKCTERQVNYLGIMHFNPMPKENCFYEERFLNKSSIDQKLYLGVCLVLKKKNICVLLVTCDFKLRSEQCDKGVNSATRSMSESFLIVVWRITKWICELEMISLIQPRPYKILAYLHRVRTFAERNTILLCFLENPIISWILLLLNNLEQYSRSSLLHSALF